MSTSIFKNGNAERDEEGREFLSSEAWKKMVESVGIFTTSDKRITFTNFVFRALEH